MRTSVNLSFTTYDDEDDHVEGGNITFNASYMDAHEVLAYVSRFLMAMGYAEYELEPRSRASSPRPD